MRAFNKLKSKVAVSPRESLKSDASSRTSMSRSSKMSSRDQEYTVEDFEKMDNFPHLVPLKELRSDERLRGAVNKLRLCSVEVRTDTFGRKSTNKVEVKRQTLLELTEFINSSSSTGLLDGLFLKELIACISANIFRALPPKTENYEPDEDDPVLDPSWPHLQVVYELLLRLIVHPELSAKNAKKQNLIDQSFCLKLIQLFDSEDPRERDYLKTILHRVYGKFMSHRSSLRKAISHVFVTFVYDSELRQHNGIGELLEILGSIINGFALPLKDEHVTFLERALIPLHKTKSIATYHPQLAYCIVQYSEKDPQCAIMVVNNLVKNWPWSSSTKQLLFLNELEEILEVIQHEDVEKVKDPLFHCIAECIGSLHFQVAERTLFLWHNEILLKNGFLQDAYAHEVLPVIFPYLYDSAENEHWNSTVVGLCDKVLQIYKDNDMSLYDKCLADHLAGKNNSKRTEIRMKKWNEIENTIQNE